MGNENNMIFICYTRQKNVLLLFKLYFKGMRAFLYIIIWVLRVYFTVEWVYFFFIKFFFSPPILISIMQTMIYVNCMRIFCVCRTHKYKYLLYESSNKLLTVILGNWNGLESFFVSYTHVGIHDLSRGQRKFHFKVAWNSKFDSKWGANNYGKSFSTIRLFAHYSFIIHLPFPNYIHHRYFPVRSTFRYSRGWS